MYIRLTHTHIDTHNTFSLTHLQWYAQAHFRTHKDWEHRHTHTHTHTHIRVFRHIFAHTHTRYRHAYTHTTERYIGLHNTIYAQAGHAPQT